MIVAFDPGVRKIGWATVEPGTGRVERCGVITTERGDAAASVDRARRFREALSIMAELVHGATTVAGEAPLSFGPIQAVAPQIECWGLLVALAGELPLFEVTAKTWQHAVMPEPVAPPPPLRPARAKGTPKPRPAKINYKQLEAKLAAHMGRAALAHIKPDDRTHALDAIGVGVLVALRPHLATRI